MLVEKQKIQSDLSSYVETQMLIAELSKKVEDLLEENARLKVENQSFLKLIAIHT